MLHIFNNPKLGHTLGKNVCSRLVLGKMCRNIERYVFRASPDGAHFFISAKNRDGKREEEKTMETYCGANCGNCGYGHANACAGCRATCGKPFGKQCFLAQAVLNGGADAIRKRTEEIVGELNALNLPGFPVVGELYPLCGALVNLSCPLPSGESVRLLDDRKIYLGTRVQRAEKPGRWYGVAADEDLQIGRAHV